MKVSIIVVNFNGSELLKVCLASLFALRFDRREIIVVDNGSSDDSVHVVRSHFPDAKIIELESNRGFTGGNLAGLQASSGEFVALANNDTRVEAGWLDHLLQPMLDDPRVGVCASQIIFTGTEKINSAGDGITTAGVGLNHGLNGNRAEFRLLRPAFGACGAAVLYRRKMLDEIGFLDEDFFLYDEDTDLNFRAQLAGWKCVYVPNAVAYHHSNATARRLSDLHVYYHTRNLEFVYIKNMPLALMIRFAHHKWSQELGSLCYLCLRHGKWRAYFKAKRDALRMLPGMWRKRREIQARRRVSNAYIRALLTPMFTWDFVRRKFWQLIEG